MKPRHNSWSHNLPYITVLMFGKTATNWYCSRNSFLEIYHIILKLTSKLPISLSVKKATKCNKSYLVQTYQVLCNTMVILLWFFKDFGVICCTCKMSAIIQDKLRSLSGNSGWLSNAYIRTFYWASVMPQQYVTGWICFMMSAVMLNFLANISI